MESFGKRIMGALRIVGPGIAVAATGVGAGDLIGATAGGAKYGALLLWTALAGAVLKYFLTEGLGRWQVVTGTSLLDGWAAHLHPAVRLVFIVYFVLWSAIVTAALLSACGVAARALLPVLPATWWGVIHGLLAHFVGTDKASRLTVQLPEIRRCLALDVQAAHHGDPASTNFAEIVTAYPSILAVSTYRK